MDNKGIEIEVINDVIRINNDRFDGYNSAIKELHPEDEDLKTIFVGMAQQSANFKSILLAELKGLSGGSINEERTIFGKVYNTWVNIKVNFGGPDRQTVLESCKIGEEAVM